MNVDCIMPVLSVEIDADMHWNQIILGHKSQSLNWAGGGVDFASQFLNTAII